MLYKTTTTIKELLDTYKLSLRDLSSRQSTKKSLKEGYCIVLDKNNKVIKTKEAFETKKRVTIVFADGEIKIDL